MAFPPLVFLQSNRTAPLGVLKLRTEPELQDFIKEVHQLLTDDGFDPEATVLETTQQIRLKLTEIHAALKGDLPSLLLDLSQRQLNGSTAYEVVVRPRGAAPELNSGSAANPTQPASAASQPLCSRPAPGRHGNKQQPWQKRVKVLVEKHHPRIEEACSRQSRLTALQDLAQPHCSL
jgi:hypothetical protein